MTDLGLAAAILGFVSSVIDFVTVLLERLPVRKDKEP